MAGNVMPLAEESGEDIYDSRESVTSSPLGDDATHVHVIMTENGDIIATGTINRAGIATTLPGIIDVTTTSSMTALGNENTPTASTASSTRPDR